MVTKYLVEDTTRGGGMPLFKIRYAKLLEELGPFAAKSLSRIEEGEPAPSLLGKAFDEQLQRAFESMQGL
jgi:hypothetical protein